MTQQEIKDKIADWKTRLKNPSVASVASAVTKINSEIAKYEAMLEDENPAKVKAPKTEKKAKVEKVEKEDESESEIFAKFEDKVIESLEKESKITHKLAIEITAKWNNLIEVEMNNDKTPTEVAEILMNKYFTEKNLLGKKDKSEKSETKESKKDDYDCDDLIKEAKERHAKAKAAAEARAEAPKKTEATKDKEKIEKVHEAVEKQVEAGKLTKKQLVTLINETKDLLKLLEKALKNL
jgi:hypothetical protein